MKLLQNEQLISIPSTWKDLPYGECYRETLENYLKEWWPRIRGFNMLKIGSLSANLTTKDCVVFYQINVGFKGEYLQIIVDYDQLPFANKSVDICLLIHTLSYIKHPYRLLQEIDRVLSDDGWLIISTFNLISILGLSRVIYFFFRKPFKYRLYTLIKLLYWLRLLNFEIVNKAHLQLFPWKSHENNCLFSKYFIFIGCLNIIIARKQIIPFQLIPLNIQNYFFSLY
ncbi:methyltransferase domain-containing protein [Blochmannia endosymbiont of Camponotus (Colobopsis) obliquus]|uniref:methyltransferase domain-containing protein n=1 Tax=Blochmannia endosymbiont of Camponotus (Colobopsis) obliquus TaxID=1505597 RepID=UPI00061A5358|nr:methyltransferase domain-containing protein [Blochmannia endosymbiont of Camponotus (Colobopsis) obliquus]AKC60393.1 Uncharacterized protein YafS [Blochmannia endosymbiont of Camponotus (Colobopsis) obliquus]